MHDVTAQRPTYGRVLELAFLPLLELNFDGQ
jgi:hypothetical protein